MNTATPERSVRRLRLRAASAADAWRGQQRLEDALRCASLPAALNSARLLIVRRLDLGRIDAGASPLAWTTRVEAAIARASEHAVHALQPDAACAEAVWFDDVLQAHLALGLRLTRGPAPREWFWPRVLQGGVGSGLSPGGFDVVASPPHASDMHALPAGPAGLRAVWHSLLAMDSAPAALPAWLAGLAQAGQVPALLAMLDGVDLAPAWRAIGAAPAAEPSPGGTPDIAIEIEPATVRRASPKVARSRDLPLPPHERPARARSESIDFLARALARAGIDAPRVRAWLPSLAAEPSIVHAPATARTATERRVQDLLAPSHAASRARPATPPLAPVLATPSAHPSQPITVDAKRDDRPRPHDAIRADAAAPGDTVFEAFLPDAAHSAAAGALFLLPVLAQLGIAAWADAQDDAQAAPRLVARLWRRLFERLELGADDVAWHLCKLESERTDETTDNEVLASQAEAWLARVRRWLRLHAGIGPASLVVRPGHLSLGPTHLEAHFDLQQVDLRVRRAGLDIDCGWLPWLGRVVVFRYGALPRRLA